MYKLQNNFVFYEEPKTNSVFLFDNRKINEPKIFLAHQITNKKIKNRSHVFSMQRTFTVCAMDTKIPSALITAQVLWRQ